MIYLIVKGDRKAAERACWERNIGFCYATPIGPNQVSGHAPDDDERKIIDWFTQDRQLAPFPVGSLLWYDKRDDITPFPANRPEDGAFAKRELPPLPHDPADMQGLPIMPINQAGYPSVIWHVHIGTGDVTLRVDNDDPRKLYVETNYDGVESLDLAEASHMLAVLANIVDWMRQQPEQLDPLDEPDGWALLPIEDQLAHINGVVRRDRDVLKRQWVLDWMFAHWNLVTIEVTR